jgi:ribosomal protein S18 acetylase RimI-like enzyme
MYTIQAAPIPVTVYCQLRQLTGLSAKSLAAAETGLKNSVYSVIVKHEEEIIGMGRIIGDGGCFCQVVDICVLPAYQGQSIGKMIMQNIADFIYTQLPPTCYVSLLADGEAYRLYAQYGFKETYPESRGMYLRVG